MFTVTGKTFAAELSGCQISTDYAGKPCLLLYYRYVNNQSMASCAENDIKIDIYQDGQKMPFAIPDLNNSGTHLSYKNAAPGETVTICQANRLIGPGDILIKVSPKSMISQASPLEVTLHYK